MQNKKQKIFCIIPAFNEEEHISKILDEVKTMVDTVVIVDDCSTDKTHHIAKEKEEEGIIVLRHIINRGQGAALQTGNDYANKNNADIIVHFDADGQFLAKEIKDVIEPIIKNEAEIVFGSRFLEKKSNIPFLKKKIILPTAKLVNKIFAGANLTDPQSGFRAMSKNAALSLQINQDQMAHCSEIIFKTFKYKLPVKEVPITVIYHNFGQRFSGGVKIFKDLILGKFID